MIKSKIGLLILGVLFITVGFTACEADNKKNPNNKKLQLYSTTEQRRTPDSPLVLSKSGESEEFLSWIDESMEKFAKDVKSEGREYDIDAKSKYIYVLDDCVLSPIDKAPSFLVSANNYDGTIYDQNPEPGIGEVYAAEMVINDKFGNPTNSWVICKSDDKQYVINASRYGYEHVYLYDHYRDEFNRTATHTQGGHPLIKEAN